MELHFNRNVAKATSQSGKLFRKEKKTYTHRPHNKSKQLFKNIPVMDTRRYRNVEIFVKKITTFRFGRNNNRFEAPTLLVSRYEHIKTNPAAGEFRNSDHINLFIARHFRKIGAEMLFGLRCELNRRTGGVVNSPTIPQRRSNATTFIIKYSANLRPPNNSLNVCQTIYLIVGLEEQ